MGAHQTVENEAVQTGAGADAFGAFLVDQGILSEAAWARVVEVRAEARQGLAGTLVGLGLLSEKDLSLALARFLDLPHAGADDWPLSPLDIPDLNPTFLRACHILPVAAVGGTLTAISADPTSGYAARALVFATDRQVTLKIGTLREVEAAITDLYFGGEAQDGADDDLAGLAGIPGT